MKLPRLFFLAMLAGLVTVAAPAQDNTAADASAVDATGSPAAPPGSTVITSDELHMDQTSHTSVFSGNVIAVGTNFKMTCEEMTVTFTTDNKVDTILAKGNVVIIQPGRITHSGVAEYDHDDDKFILTDSPVINNDGNEISAPKITIYRTKQTLETEGPSKVVLQQGPGSNAGGAPATTNSTAQ